MTLHVEDEVEKGQGDVAVLTGLVIDRIDLVDLGENHAADILLWKRRKPGQAAPVRKAYSSEPRTTDEVVADKEVHEAFWRLRCAFDESLESIMRADISDAEKAGLVTQSMREFISAAEDLGLDTAGQKPEGVVAKTAEAAHAAAREVLKHLEASMSKQTGDAGELKIEQIPEAQRAAVDALQKRAARVEPLEADLKKANEDLAAVTKERDRLVAAGETPEAIEKRKMDALPSDVRKKLEDQDTVIKRLEEKDETAEIAKGLSAVPLFGTTAEKLAPVMRRVRKGLSTAEDVTELERVLKSMGELIKKGGPVALIEGGSSGVDAPAAGSAMDQAVEMAKGLLTEGKAKNKSEALAKVWDAHPDLYKRHREEQSESASRRRSA